eukprot:UN02868
MSQLLHTILLLTTYGDNVCFFLLAVIQKKEVLCLFSIYMLPKWTKECF